MAKTVIKPVIRSTYLGENITFACLVTNPPCPCVLCVEERAAKEEVKRAAKKEVERAAKHIDDYYSGRWNVRR